MTTIVKEIERLDKELNAFMIYLLLKDYGKDKLIKIINKVDKVSNND